MKQLQNNFTTPEQSKRLLELGVPADSADCYLHNDISHDNWEADILKRDYKYQSNICRAYTNYLPCWSVGRLFQIYCITKGITYKQLSIYCLDDLLSMFDCDYENLDFSKLEE